MKKILLILSTVLLLVACEDFLDTEPLTVKVNTNFYQTPEDMESALIAIYSAMAPTDISTSSFVASELMSGERYPGGGPDDEHAFAMSQFKQLGQNMYAATWARNYQGIFRANMLLTSFDQVEFDNQAQADKVEGEARFLRAYYYFELAKMFGTVPLLLDPKPDNLPQADVDDLYAQIAEDLKIAIEKLPSAKWSPRDIGRTTKWAAQGYMARIFLFYTGVYNKSDLPLASGGSVTKSQVVEWIDDCAVNSGHDLLEKFGNLWPYSVRVNGETEYKYADDNDLAWVGEEGNNIEVMYSIRYSIHSSWSNTYYGNQLPLFFSWREQTKLPFGQGWGWGPVTTLLWDSWPNNDPRKAASICDVTNTDVEGNVDYKWGSDHQQQETGLWQKKYVAVNVQHPDKPEGEYINYSFVLYNGLSDYMLNNTQETVLLRYADILLMGAELGSSKAQAYMDQVRGRVGLDGVAPTLENIKNERRWELAFEGLRYYDLLRWGDAEKEINKLTNIPVINDGKNATYSTKFRPETNGFLPIPNDQIALSEGVLTQNPGW